jgi:hypothetical protein
MLFAAFVSKMGLNIEFSYLRDLPVNLHQYPLKVSLRCRFLENPEQNAASNSCNPPRIGEMAL